MFLSIRNKHSKEQQTGSDPRNEFHSVDSGIDNKKLGFFKSILPKDKKKVNSVPEHKLTDLPCIYPSAHLESDTYYKSSNRAASKASLRKQHNYSICCSSNFIITYSNDYSRGNRISLTIPSTLTASYITHQSNSKEKY